MKPILCHLLLLLLLCLPFCLAAQKELYTKTFIAGKMYDAIITEDGDTIPIANLDMVTISFKRDFETRDDRLRYFQMRENALKVYPYAKEAIKLYREMEVATVKMNDRQRKKHNKKLEKELTPKYEQELKNLTRTQGYILMKMVERELDVPFYRVISSARGGWEAFKWQQAGRFYGFNLKKGYDAEDDPLLELILSDLNISYQY